MSNARAKPITQASFVQTNPPIPLVDVVKRRVSMWKDGLNVETLACGHHVIVRARSRPAKQRRCVECRSAGGGGK